MQTQPKFYGVLCFARFHDQTGALRLTNESDWIDLHLNLWEREAQNFLDVGVRFNRECKYDYLRFYFPWAINEHAPEDLVDKINHASSVASIFNESWVVEQRGGTSHALVRDSMSNDPVFEILRLSDALSQEKRDDQSHFIDIDVSKLKALCDKSSSYCYVRFRVFGMPRSVYLVPHIQGDAGLVSSWTQTEDLDFRLNVRRGVPVDMERSVGAFVPFKKVHLFLMRDRAYELVYQDSAFKSCRSLEDENFWANYSATVGSPPDSLKKTISSCFGYQWTKKFSEPQSPVDEFRILARFKRTRLSKLKFAIIVVVLGAVGNALWEFVSGTIGPKFLSMINFLVTK